MNVRKIIVTVLDDRLRHVDEVVARLESKGMRSTTVLSMSGIITGEANADAIPGLRKVWGVAAVERDSEMEAT